MKRKWMALGASVLVVSMLFSGCAVKVSEESATPQGTAKETSPETPQEEAAIEKFGVKLENLDLDDSLKGQYEGKTLVVPVMSGDFEKAINDVVPIFEKLSGAKVVVESVPGEQFTEKVQLDMNNTQRYDIILSPVAFMRTYAEAGKVLELQPLIDSYASKSYDTSDFLKGLFETYGIYKDKLYAIPYKPDVQLLFYRKDLFEDQGIKDKFFAKYNKELKVPETNEEMLEIAEFFTKSINPDSPIDYGYVNCMLKGASRWTWINRGGTQLDENLNPNFNNKNGLKAFEDLLKLQSYAPKEWLQMGWDEGNQFFANGNAAMMEQWPGLWNTCQGEGSAIKDKVGVAVTPGKTPTLGGWSVGISANTKEQELAWKFVEFITSKDGELLKIENTMDPCRSSTYEIKGVADYSPLYAALMESFNYASVLADVDAPYISAKLNDVMELYMQVALIGEITPEEALQKMEEDFTGELKSAGLIK
jgi:ABC-type glycerol-3-phosphate transport system substrate-binding protein